MADDRKTEACTSGQPEPSAIPEQTSDSNSDRAVDTMQLRTGALCEWPVSRRDFVKGASAVFGISTLAPALAHASTTSSAPSRVLPLTLRINGESRQLTIDPRTSLLDLLREEMKLTGTKKGCDHGQCGACTVLVNGRRMNSCLSLAISHDGDEVTTIEGLAKGATLDPVQQAFLDNDGYQCGYCTPGQIISAVALLGEAAHGEASVVTGDLRKAGPVDLSVEEIRERMSGNICRCGAYPGIVAAVRQAYQKTSEHRANGDSAREGEAIATL